MYLILATVKIKGTRPLLFHCFTPDTISLQKKERTGVAGNDPEEWKRTYTATSGGQLYLSSTYIFGCLRDAARYTKKGRGSIQSDLSATLQVIDDKILLNRFINNQGDITTNSSQAVYVDVQSIRNPATKGRNVRYRLGLSPGWETSFTLLWDVTLVNRTQMEAVCIDAGKLVGLADGRSIGMGRFEVVSFEANNAQKATS
ncbi:hypothetical protein BC351_33120 [Paenibacillus ferrarius]|uniref:CRISPR-associated protein n=1 Tax=Paenibacillus ferrarius TaxID=1469647 RepID=A0A1V4HE60_9BACL|nr:hypothetical protein BC351_33120 [Paenibacillus ferrarius]